LVLFLGQTPYYLLKLRKKPVLLMTLDALRQYFPHVQNSTYLNHAATGPLSRPVVEAVQDFMSERHRTHIQNYDTLEPVLERAKERLGRVAGASPERIAFAPNTSYALNVLARGLAWHEGDRVAVPGCEFPANAYPFLNLEGRGVEVDVIPHDEGTFTLDDIRSTLRDETRLISLSWVQFLSGFRTDLEAVGRLCQKENVLLCVDAIQGAGALQFDVESAGIDFLACGSHKWLMGAQGFGFLYVTEALQNKLDAPAGWLHGPIDWEHLFDYDLTFHETAERFRLGTLNATGAVALEAALALYEEAGLDWCERQVRSRAQELARGFEERGLERYGSSDPAHGSSIVTIRHPQPEALVDHLAEEGIEIAMRNRLVRFSPSYYNTPDEMERTLDAIDAFG
jgi:selenocysteine lyase/cysteine desulfurase